MAGRDEPKLGLLRRCDLLVNVVRCFDLYAPKAFVRRDEVGDKDGVDEDEEALPIALTPREERWQQEWLDQRDVEWPLGAAPLEDVMSTTADMAYADLQFIQERHR